jgi:anti-sigma factor RsiW
MGCVLPPELDEIQLLAYQDGEADAEVVSHLEQCPHCRGRALRLARFQDRLIAQLYRVTCPDSLELGEYHLGLLSHERTADVAQHLDDCPLCRDEVAQLTDYLAELAPDLEVSPLERVKVWVAQLVNVAREMGRPGAPVLAPAYVSVRGEEEGPYIYEAGDVQIAIEVQDDAEQPGRKVLLGLMTGMEPGGWQAHLWQGDQRIAQAPVDELGNFDLSRLVPEVYDLILSGSETEIHIQEVDVGTG